MSDSSVDGSAAPETSFVDIEVDIDPIWLGTAKYGGGTYGDLWIPSADDWSITTSLFALFSTIDDEGITEDSAVMYADTDVPGRAEMYKTYMGTTNREIAIGFQFHAQIPDSTETDEDGVNLVVKYAPNWCVQAVRWLDLLKQPVYDPSQDVTYPPPPVILRVGNLLAARCILTGGSPRWIGPFDPDTMFPNCAEFHAVFTNVRNYPWTGDGDDPYDAYVGTPTPGACIFTRFQAASTGF